MFSLETASDYMRNDRAITYGFKCLVIGYDWITSGNGLKNLEIELSFLGGACAASLMKRNLALPPVSSTYLLICLILIVSFLYHNYSFDYLIVGIVFQFRLYHFRRGSGRGFGADARNCKEDFFRTFDLTWTRIRSSFTPYGIPGPRWRSSVQVSAKCFLFSTRTLESSSSSRELKVEMEWSIFIDDTNIIHD